MTQVQVQQSPIQAVEAIAPQPAPYLEQPSTWMRYGSSPAEIILSLSIFVGAISGLVSVLVPVMQQRKS